MGTPEKLGDPSRSIRPRPTTASVRRSGQRFRSHRKTHTVHRSVDTKQSDPQPAIILVRSASGSENSPSTAKKGQYFAFVNIRLRGPSASLRLPSLGARAGVSWTSSVAFTFRFQLQELS